MDWLKDMYEDHGAVLKICNLLTAYSKKLGEGKEDAGKLDEILELVHMFTERCHHGKEEKALFPVIGKRNHDLIAILVKEHAEGKRLMQIVRDGARNDKIAAIRSYGELTRAHIMKENLFFNDCHGKQGDEDRKALSLAFSRINSAALGKRSSGDVLGSIGKLGASIEAL